MRSIRLVLAVALLGLTGSVSAAFNPETGSYLFQRYTAKQYGASPQNWGVAQDNRGITYFANTDGLLEFDGTNWRTLRLPQKMVARSVSVDDGQTVYVGGVGDFGVLKPDATGTLQFVSLLDRAPQADRAFADVWRILPTPAGTYFRASNRLFRLNKDGSIKVWRLERKFARAFYVLDTLYVQAADVGLQRLGSDDKLTLVPGGERFARDVVNAAVPFGSDALIATASHLFRLTRTGVEPFATSADPWLASSLAYSMLDLPGGEIAIGSRKGGLLLLSRDGTVDRILSAADGLADDFVLDIFADAQGGIWLAQNSGITRFNPGLSSYGKPQKLEGDVQTMERHEGALFAGTTAGLFRLRPERGAEPQFTRIDGIASSVFALLTHGHELLAATDLGVFSITGDRARKVFESARLVYDLSTSLHDPSTIYAARRTAVTVLTRRGSEWTKTAEFETPGQDFRTVLEDSDGRVWATTERNIWRFDFRGPEVKSEQFGVAQGVPSGWINARRLDGHVAFATTKGLKRFDEASHTFVPDPTLGVQFSDGSRDVFNIFSDPTNNVWITGENYHGILHRAAGKSQWLPMPLLRSGISEIYWMSPDADGTVWATGADFVLNRWDPAAAGDPDRDFRVLTRRVEVTGESGNWYGGAGKPSTEKFPWKRNNLRFEFSAPFYEQPSAVEYQVRLTGSDADWSRWSHETWREYTHLPEGKFQFEVRARNPHGATAEDSGLSFGVLPPWYRTWWAYILYALLSASAITAFVRLRTRQLEEDKRKLESIVEERTLEVRQQRDEIQVQERRTHSLLLNILPAKVADELKSTGSVQPVGFDDVTVCFTDFVGFTLSSEQMAPQHLVETLNEYFTRFDEIIARYGLEKLKTIGDSYMFASGLPAPRASHAVDAVLAALEMVEVVKELAARKGDVSWDIRVGLHSGPVVAGVVGTRKFAFDIWGNTVNFAARMESSGVPGRVNMSERTCSLTRGLIDVEARGHVKIKEGRQLEMFLAVGPAQRYLVGEVRDGVHDAFAARYSEEFGVPPRACADIRRAFAAS